MSEQLPSIGNSDSDPELAALTLCLDLVSVLDPDPSSDPEPTELTFGPGPGPSSDPEPSELTLLDFGPGPGPSSERELTELTLLDLPSSEQKPEPEPKQEPAELTSIRKTKFQIPEMTPTSSQKTRLQKIRQSSITNRPRTMLIDDFPIWQEMTEYHRRSFINQYVYRTEKFEFAPGDFVKYSFRNIIYDKVKRKIIKMEYVLKEKK